MTARIFKDTISGALLILGPSPKFEGKTALTIFSLIDGEYLPSYDYTIEFGYENDVERPIDLFDCIGTIIKTKHETFEEWVDDQGEDKILSSIEQDNAYLELVEMKDYDLQTEETVGDHECLYNATYHIDKSIYDKVA